MCGLEKFGTCDKSSWEVYQEKAFYWTVRRIICPKFLWKLFGVHTDSPECKKLREETVKSIQDIFEKRLDQIKSGEYEKSKWDMDVLQRLVVNYEQGLLTKEEIYSEILGFYLAGHEYLMIDIGQQQILYLLRYWNSAEILI
jgi:cytochrome P450